LVSSAHRGESFKACEFLMDYLKTQAPFWKKEHTPSGGRWVDASFLFFGRTSSYHEKRRKGKNREEILSHDFG